MSTRRLEAFSDGVFAVAITFLVFNLRVPVAANGHLARLLRDQWPSYASYVVSFLIIGIMWVNHHGLFHRLAGVDRPLLFLNLLLLMSVAVLPYPTALLSQYIQSGPDSHVAAAVYSATMTMASIGFGLIWTYAVYHHELLEDRFDPLLAKASIPRFGVGVVIYLLTIGIAFINAILVLAIHALLAPYYVFDRLSAPKVPARPPG